jgi:DNA replication initiation complex subunit (GINS family)
MFFLDMISYNDIYEASRKERYSEELQPISRKFIFDVSKYFEEKERITQKADDLSLDILIKTKKQLENARTLFRELMLRRRRKILNLVLIASETGISKQDFDNMLGFEKELFEKIMESINVSEKKLSEEFKGNTEKEQKNQLVSFLEDVREFVGFEGEKMGPFEKGQIANIPKEVAKILIEDNKAEEIAE